MKPGAHRKASVQVTAASLPSSDEATNQMHYLPDADSQELSIETIDAGIIVQSYAQEHLWVTHQHNYDQKGLNVACAFRLQGLLQVDALNKALTALQHRHEVLRTTFASHDGVNVQVVQASHFELMGVSLGEESISTALGREASAPFDLQTKPAWRVALFRVEENDHVLSITMHRIICDSRSAAILQRDLGALYATAIRPEDPMLPLNSLQFQYRDFSAWQRRRCQVPQHQDQLEYWVKELDASKPAEIPFDKPRPTALSGRIYKDHITLASEVDSQIEEFCQTQHVTPLITLIAAFRATHYRLTGMADATIGVDNSGRHVAGADDVIGLFENTQCLRTAIDTDSFEELVQKIQTKFTEGSANQDVPYDLVESTLRRDSDISQDSLAKILFVLHPEEELGEKPFDNLGLSIAPMESTVRSKFDLEFHCYADGQGLKLVAQCAEELYNPETIINTLSIFRKTLESCLKSPSQPITSLSLFDDQDLKRLLTLGLVHTTHRDDPQENSIVDVFRQQVSDFPETLAVKDSLTHLTYSQLDLRSDCIARWLLQRDLPAGTLIGVFAGRSCETVAAFLGILKANMAYLPLDVRTPVIRLNTIMSCMSPTRLALIGSDMVAPAVDLEGVEFSPIAEALKASADDSIADKERLAANAPSAASLAYVMFTSGSTGQPKGVMIEHRNVIRLVKDSNVIEQAPLHPVIGHISNIAFDAATWDIFAALLNGGTVVCIDHLTTLDTNAMAKIFRQEKINNIFLTAALFKQYVREDPTLLATIDSVFVGGDRVDPNDLSLFRGVMKDKFVNAYGPTENTVFSTTFCVDRSMQDTFPTIIPIGRAVTRSGAYVIDSQMSLVPLGVVGELFLTGDGLARGYTDPERDVDTFVSLSIAGSTIRGYRTGDVVRYRPIDGQLEFLRRLDGQVKVRGHRVELTEIERVLSVHENADEAVVLAQACDDGNELMGFVSVRQLEPADHGESFNIEESDKNADHVDMWEAAFDEDTYQGIDDLQGEAIGRDFVGWTSMYDGSKIDTGEMNEWLDDTIATIVKGGSPRHVIEIGSGTGMILFNLPEGLQSYVGFDPSGKAVDFVRRAAKSTPRLSGKVRVHKGTAMDIRKIESSVSPETLVVVNSVAQYFPSQQYLLKLIETIIQQLGNVNQIFFGDMRSNALQEQFLATKALHLSLPNVSQKVIEQTMAEMAGKELELLVDPAFFTSLVEKFPGQIQHVEIIPKKMKATNELSCYRFAAILHLGKGEVSGPSPISVPAADWVDFSREGLTRQSLFRSLNELPETPYLAISNIPYSKTILERQLLESIKEAHRVKQELGESPEWLSSLRQASQQYPSLSPLDLTDLAQEAGLHVEISWARQFSQHGALDAIFYRNNTPGAQMTKFQFPHDHTGRAPQHFSSHPWLQQMKQRIRDDLYETMKARLPPYMIPRNITVLDRLPVNENGKLDRRALLNLGQQQLPTTRNVYRSPTTAVEKKIQDIWSRILRVDASRIGLDDSFFQLGGTSITAMRVVGEARAAGLVLSVADIFRNPSLEHTASSARENVEEAQPTQPFSLLPGGLDVNMFLEDISKRYRLPSNAIEDVYPCTPLQEGLLSLTLKRPGDYISQAPMRLPPNASIEDLQRAWETVSQATPALRTRVIPHETGLLQVVMDEKIEWVQSDSLEDYLEADRKLSMDIGKPLARYALISNQDGSAPWFVWTIHHALFDGWSMSLLMDSVNRAFDGEPIASGPPFSSFIKYIKQQDDAAIASYWQVYLEGCVDSVPFPALPPSISEPKTDTVIEHSLPLVRVQGVEITISSIIRGAWALVVGQMTDSSDVLFGSTLSGRNAPVKNVEHMMAPAFATVPVRVQIDLQQSVQHYLQGIHEQATKMIPFEQTGLARIAKATQQVCQFQTLLLVQAQENMPATTASKKLDFDWQPHKSKQEQWFNPYALMLEMYMGSDHLLAQASFDSRVIEPEVVKSLLSRLEYVMQQLGQINPRQTMGDIQLLSEQDMGQIWRWNGAVPPPVDQCLHNMVSLQVAANPHAPAVCAWDGDLTYGELDRLSSALSEQLFHAGVRPDMLVPLCFEKSMWTPVALLGVLKAGGAFVLLEPSLPEQRLRSIVRQLGTEMILCSQSNADLGSRLADMVIPVAAETINAWSEGDVVVSIPSIQSSSTTAFALFTSGSTGTPKGVVVTHSQFASSMTYQSQVLGFNAQSRLFDFAAYAFDIAVHNVIAALTNGSCLCIPHEHDRKNNVGAAMSSMRVTIANLTPSVARLIDPQSVGSLETLILAGEAVSQVDGEQWANTSTRVINAYGPAECTISTINANATTAEDLRRIGKGTGVATWIVDPNDHNVLLPLGCVGELLIEGPPVCQGYLGDAAKTSAMFIHDPEWLIKGSPEHASGRSGRLYKTGDLVRYNADGSLSFVGRKDTQVKIRGQRVELGEIEHCISRCMTEVSRVVVEVVSLPGKNERSILAAFLETAEVAGPDGPSHGSSNQIEMLQISHETEEQILQSLPRYMLPDAFFSLKHLPETKTGKIDRRQIRSMAISPSLEKRIKPQVATQPKRQPTSAAEHHMQRIWAKVLGFDDYTLVGVNDSFFALGGNSIDAMKVVGETRKVGLELTTADVFRFPLLEQLARRTRSSQSTSIPRLEKYGAVQQSFAQGRLWFIEQLHPGLSWYLMPFAARLRGPIQLEALNSAISALEMRHESLRTTFFSEKGENMQQVHSFRKKPLRIVEIHLGNQDALLQALREEQTSPFDLNNESGWRVCVYRLAQNDHVLSIVMHHIIADGWSLDILQRELATFYSASVSGSQDAQLHLHVEDLPIQYQDFAVWQRRRQKEADFERQLDYWVQTLEPSRPAEFFCDKPRPDSLSGRAGREKLKIQGPSYNAFQSFCKSSGVTQFTALLAAFRATHFRLTGVADAIIGCPNANRDLWEVKNLIGFFVNMQCLRLKIDGKTSFQDLVRQTSVAISDSFANQDIPFESIVSKLQKGRDLSRNPLAQVTFVLHSQKDLGKFHLEGVDSEALDNDLASRFDLEFHLFQETDGVHGEVIFSEDLFETATIRSIISTFLKMLDSGTREPNIEIASLPLWEQDADFSILHGLGLLEVEKTAYARDSNIVEVFQEQVALYPTKTAIKDSSTEITYSQLDLASDNMAGWLRKRSLEKQSLVGIFATRSCENIVAMLGILKAGLAYLPLDVKTPEPRMEKIISSVNGQTLVLVGAGATLPNINPQQVEFVKIADALHDSAISHTNGWHQPDIFETPGPTSLAYVMFTSGSTGQPKGVMIEHRGVVSLVKNSNMIHHRPEETVMAHMANLAFDVSTWEIYAALLNGGTLVCVDAAEVLEPTLLNDLFRSQGVHGALFTPVLLEQYIQSCPAVLEQLEVLYVGGDVFEPKTLRAARKLMTGNIINAYGPTENTGASTSYFVPASDPCTNGVPIGRALSNSGAYVMDSELRLVPLGVLGELVVTGDGLARGYTDPSRNRPFIPVTVCGQQIDGYRTGDCARYRPCDGQLEVFGRIDRQVKLRGNRIELTEIEHALLAHQSVSTAAAVLFEGDDKTEPQLAAFVTIGGSEHEKLETAIASATAAHGEDEEEQVRVWENLFDADTYNDIGNSIQAAKIGRDYSGWVSMYDGSEIPTAEMDEWLDDALATMLNDGEPGDVLELGSGTGMMLFNLGEGLASYVGLDPSKNAVDFLKQTVARMPELADKVRVFRGAATDLDRYKDTIAPNLVVLNSVVQYFPSQKYLLEALEGILKLQSVRTVFLGDIRSYALHRQFQVSKAVHRLGKTNISQEELRQEMGRIEESEMEFLVDPGFFTALQDHETLSPLIEHVEILPKTMTATNELSCYRYSAVIHAKVANGAPREVHSVPLNHWTDFTKHSLTKESLVRILEDKSTSRLTNIAISNIPHSKSSWERHVVASLDAGKQDTSFHPGDWLSPVHLAAERCPSLSATVLREIALQTGHRVEISWARQFTQSGGMDAIFHKLEPMGGEERVLFKFPSDHRGRSSHTLASQPLLQQMKRKTAAQLREMLTAQLPAYMVPRTISILTQLPVNANGKVDRGALVNKVKTTKNGAIQPLALRKPRTEAQSILRGVWADVLGRNTATIGLDDNFFLLGGDSITAMRLVSKAHMSSIQLSVADIFKYQTLEQLAAHQRHIVLNDLEVDDIEPFGLLPKDIDIPSLLASLAAAYQLSPAHVQDLYPCTPLQEGLVSLTFKRPGDYMMRETIELPPELSLVAFQRAWNEVVKAMPILRTRIVNVDQIGLLQVVMDEELNWEEASDLQRYLHSDRKLSMELGQSLARFALISSNSGKTRHFVWTMHHAVYDGWSFGLIMDAFYQAFSGKPVITGSRYANFIKYLAERNLEDSARYWKQELDQSESVSFPVVPPSIQQPTSDKMVTHRFECSQSQGSGVTPALRIRAAWALVSGQLSNTHDTTFGVTLSGRNAPVDGIDKLAAPTFATVPVRIRWTQDMQVSDYLRMVQEQATAMIPFEQTGLHHIAALSPGCQQACRFQTLLVIQTKPVFSAESQSVEWFKMSENNSQEQRRFNPYALMLEVEVDGNKITARASFDSGIIKENMMQRILERLPHLMHQLESAAAGQTLAEIHMVSARDLRDIWRWNATLPESIDRCVHDLISERATARPNAPAVHAWDGELTYTQLDDLSWTLATHLATLGIGQGCLVPICFEKSLWTSVAILGILKTGAAFVLLDTSLPEQRLQYIVEQSGSQLIVSSVSKQDLGSRLAHEVLVVGPKSSSTLEIESSSSIRQRLRRLHTAPSSLMCAVFTSGSTGKPKGVMLTHANFVSGMHYQSELLRFTEKARVFDFASYAFDIAIHNALTTWSTGGCLCVPSDQQRKENIAETMAAMRVNIADLTPSVARLIQPDTVPSLETLIVAGEAVSVGDATRWLDREAPTKFINAYGPAECGISTINCDDGSPERLVSIGKGAGLITWVVDPQDPGKLVAPGCPGELLLEGPLVGAGYLGEPQKTKESFLESPPTWLASPAVDVPGRHSRLYKTGDLVKQDEEGRLEFLGRKDSQVKIRGQRVELGEIENCIQECMPKARQVAVEVMLQDSDGTDVTPRIAAFVEFDVNQSSTAASLFAVSAEMESHLHRQLPSYMIPAAFISVAEMPITATGKTDRKHLREMGRACLAASMHDFEIVVNGTAAENGNSADLIFETEETAYALAQKVLSMNPTWNAGSPQSAAKNGEHKLKTGIINKTLHSCGLDSLNMMSLKYYISQHFKVAITMQLLIDRVTTIRSLAHFINTAQASNGSNGHVSNHTSGVVDLNARISHYDNFIRGRADGSSDQAVDSNKPSHVSSLSPPSLLPASQSPVTVLLTGASGFIGTQVLRQLLQHPHVSQVIVLVRGKTIQVARARTIEAAKRAQWWTNDYLGRLTVWKGDLSQAQLGLDAENWRTLSTGQEVDSIIHNGAVVHWGKSYVDLEAANVASTAALLRISIAQPDTNFVYVTGGQSHIFEDGREAEVAETLSAEGVIGYAQTKFVAEALVRRVAGRQGPSSSRFAVVSPGLVVGTATEGVANADDYLWRLAAACIKVGAYDGDEAESWLNVSDVATVATTVVDAALNPTSQKHGAVIPVNGGMKWSQFWTTLTGMGYKLQAKSAADWLSLVLHDMDKERETHPLWPIAHIVQGEGAPESHQKEGELEIQNGFAHGSGKDSRQALLQAAVVKSANFLARLGHLPDRKGSTDKQRVQNTRKGDAFGRSGL